MTERKARRSVSRSEKTRDPRSVSKFLEELSWLLSSHSNLDFKAIATTANSRRDRAGFDSYVSKNPNIHFLIGVLPVIFSDERLFPTNEDLVEFSSGALQLPITRWEKRSRYELIGLIVCETAKLDDERLERLVRALSKLLSGDPKARNVFDIRRTNKLNWNEVIQKLTAD